MPEKTFTVTKQMMVSANTGHANPGDLHVPIGRWDPVTGLAWNGRAAMYAPVSFAGMTKIVQARIFLRVHGDGGWHAKPGPNGRTLHARRKTADWHEGSHGGSTAVNELWGSNGAHVTNNNIASVQTGDLVNINGTPVHNSWHGVGCTKIVEAWFNGSPNYGLVLLNATSETNPDNAVEFWSRHVSGSQPYIWIEYEDNTPPNAPINLSPSGNQVVQSNVLSMRHSDPDGDLATSANFRLYEPAGGSQINATTGSHVLHGNNLDASWGAWPLVSGRQYSWRGRTRDAEVWGPLSSHQSFRYEPTQSAPTLTSPIGNNTIATLTPSLVGTHNLSGDSTMSHVEIDLRWNSTPGASAFTGQSRWQSGALTDSGASFSKTPPSLEWGHRFWWRARVRTSLGTWSTWSTYQSFWTQSAGGPVNVEPSGVKLSDTLGHVPIRFDASPGDEIVEYRWETYETNGTTLIRASNDHASGIVQDGARVEHDATLTFTDLSPGQDALIRVQYDADVGGTSDWSPLQPFSINAIPTQPTLLEPAAGAVVATDEPILRWRFEDPDKSEWGDTQSGYELEIRDNSDDSLIHDELNNDSSSDSFATGVADLDWDVTYKWRVKTKDGDDAWGPFSSYRTFKPSEPPVAGTPTVDPADLDGDDNVSTPTPTIEWTFTSPGSKPQARYRLQVERASDESEVYDSGWIDGTATSLQIPNGILSDETEYTMVVSVEDTDELSDQSDEGGFLTAFEPPAELEGVLTIADAETSKITVQWEVSDDPELRHYEVMRRRFGSPDWRVLAENLGPQASSFDDYTAALNVVYEYAVFQVHEIGTDLVQGEFSPVTSGLTGIPEWYLVAEGRDDLTVPLRWSEAIDERIPVQREELEALGRNFKIVVEGQVLGTEGTVSVRVDASEYEQVRDIERLLRERLGRILIKSPTGELYPSKMGDIHKTRLPRGGVRLDFGYTQIEEA